MTWKFNTVLFKEPLILCLEFFWISCLEKKLLKVKVDKSEKVEKIAHFHFQMAIILKPSHQSQKKTLDIIKTIHVLGYIPKENSFYRIVLEESQFVGAKV